MDTRYIFISGGVASSLGKGIIASSLAEPLQARGLRTAIRRSALEFSNQTQA